MELLQSQAPAERELLGISDVRTLDIGSEDIKNWIIGFGHWILELRYWDIEKRLG